MKHGSCTTNPSEGGAIFFSEVLREKLNMADSVFELLTVS